MMALPRGLLPADQLLIWRGAPGASQSAYSFPAAPRIVPVSLARLGCGPCMHHYRETIERSSSKLIVSQLCKDCRTHYT